MGLEAPDNVPRPGRPGSERRPPRYSDDEQNAAGLEGTHARAWVGEYGDRLASPMKSMKSLARTQ